MYGILALLIAVLITIFSLQNTIIVNIKFLFWHLDNVSLVAIILISALSGALIVFFFSLFKTFILKRELRSVKKEKAFLEKEVVKLNEISIAQDEVSPTTKDSQ